MMVKRSAGFCRNLVLQLLMVAVCPLVVSSAIAGFASADEPSINNARPPKVETDLRYWLENVIWYHGFDDREIAAATGLSAADIKAACAKFDIRPATRPDRPDGAPLFVLPYPGGRHPRIGFLDGAINPQRETKFSVFTPWDAESYVVVDLPEAIWSNLGLTYLAHTHVDTIWTAAGVELERLEWNRHADGRLDIERRLPNGITFAARVVPQRESVRMELSLTNGTNETLTDLRIQNCVMLKGARGFNGQTNDNKIFAKPYCACRNETGGKWIITAWEQCHRPWANERCPCLHSDPKFPDCPAGETQRLRGWLSFYEGQDIQAEFQRIEATGWRHDS